MMERFADDLDEPVDLMYFELREQLTRHNYAEIFQAIPGLSGTYVTEKRRTQLLDRIYQHLWSALDSFYNQLRGWQESWLQGAANPALLLAPLLAGGSGMALPPGIMQPPDTGVLRDHAEAVNEAINKVFAGVGRHIAAALAYDAMKIRETLLDPRLPGLIGAANREQMLKQLGVAVNATYPRLEQNLTRFVLATMQVGDQPAGDVELRYFSTLLMLGQQIDFDQLGGRGDRVTGIGGDRTHHLGGAALRGAGRGEL
jgi:hypothetical protein